MTHTPTPAELIEKIRETLNWAFDHGRYGLRESKRHEPALEGLNTLQSLFTTTQVSAEEVADKSMQAIFGDRDYHDDLRTRNTAKMVPIIQAAMLAHAQTRQQVRDEAFEAATLAFDAEIAECEQEAIDYAAQKKWSAANHWNAVAFGYECAAEILREQKGK